MNDQTPSYGTPDPARRDEVRGGPATHGEPGPRSASPRSPVEALLRTPRPGGGVPGGRVPRVRVPGSVRSAASILRGLGVIGVVVGAIGSIVGVLGLVSYLAVERSGDVLAASLVVLLVTLVVGVGLSVALLVQAPRVLGGDVRACRVAVVLLGITVGLRAVSLFPLTLDLGFLINLGLGGLAVAGLVKLRSDEARTYYAMASRQAVTGR